MFGILVKKHIADRHFPYMFFSTQVEPCHLTKRYVHGGHAVWSFGQQLFGGILVKNIWLNDIILKRHFVDTTIAFTFDKKAFGGHDVRSLGQQAFGEHDVCLFIKKHLADLNFPYIFDKARTMPIDQKALVGHVVWHFGQFLTYLIPCHLA